MATRVTPCRWLLRFAGDIATYSITLSAYVSKCASSASDGINSEQTCATRSSVLGRTGYRVAIVVYFRDSPARWRPDRSRSTARGLN